MDESRGGRLLLRKIASREIEYEGEIGTSAGTWPARFRISPVGKVDALIDAEAGAPRWLVDFAVATLRAAFRASRENGRWPRRLHRWRPAPESEGGA